MGRKVNLNSSFEIENRVVETKGILGATHIGMEDETHRYETILRQPDIIHGLIGEEKVPDIGSSGFWYPFGRGDDEITEWFVVETNLRAAVFRNEKDGLEWAQDVKYRIRIHPQ
jgi:hypothetical protein